MYQFNKTPLKSRQHGAALVIGMLLLLVITLLAISGINSTSLQLVMASNTQGFQDAFQAAESEIAVTMSEPDDFNETPPADTPIVVNCDAAGQVVQDAPMNNSGGKVGSMYFELAAEGTSIRGATATNIQGVLRVIPAQDDTFGSIAGGLESSVTCNTGGGTPGIDPRTVFN